jgi:hypothetical protein
MASESSTNEHAVAQNYPSATWGFIHYTDGEPVMEFFTRAPADTPVVFSTLYGRKARRFAVTFHEPRKIFRWSIAQIERAVSVLKVYCWGVFKTIPKPLTYQILHFYFDPFDLYSMGVQNAWNILNFLYKDTQNKLPSLIEAVRPVFQKWVGHLLEDKSRRARLQLWTPMEYNDILNVFEGNELKDLGGLDSWYFGILKDVLFQAHAALLSDTYTPLSAEGNDHQLFWISK